MKIKDIMKAYLISHRMSHVQFAKAINICRVEVTNWKNGKHEPPTDFLLTCMSLYTDWRHAWAVDCLKVKLPEVVNCGVVNIKLPLAG